eukprot:scaffold103315_cov19-Tisochrysis_lutea.AAC.1
MPHQLNRSVIVLMRQRPSLISTVTVSSTQQIILKPILETRHSTWETRTQNVPTDSKTCNELSPTIRHS